MNHHLINRLNAIANGFQYAIQYGSQYTAQYNHGAVCREAAAEIERLEKLMEQNNSKHMEVLGKLKETNDKYNDAAKRNEGLLKMYASAVEENKDLKDVLVVRNDTVDTVVKLNDEYIREKIRLKERVEELEKSFPGYETVHIRPEELRDHIAIAALEGCLSAKGWHPEYIIPAGGGHVGGQRAADAAAESAYKYADAMLKAREKKNA